jgi:hypothetical protein
VERPLPWREALKAAMHDLPGQKPVSFNVQVRPHPFLQLEILECAQAGDARQQLTEESPQVWLASFDRHLCEPEPLHCSEFSFIESDALTTLRANNIPQCNIDMARGKTNRWCASHHQRGFDFVVRKKAQLFLEFAQNRTPRMLVGLDMTARRQPQLCVPVIHQQNMITIDNGEVRHEVLRRGRGFCYTEKLGARINPGECVRQMFTLQSIEGYDCRKLGAYNFSHVR